MFGYCEWLHDKFFLGKKWRNSKVDNLNPSSTLKYIANTPHDYLATLVNDLVFMIDDWQQKL